jgi:hypothetical protein
MKRTTKTTLPSLTTQDLAAVDGGGWGHVPAGQVRGNVVSSSSDRRHASQPIRREEPRREAPRREPEPQYYVPSGTAPRGFSSRPEDQRAAQWAISQAR